jgi:predicted SAM-dependent methyltransferase
MRDTANLDLYRRARVILRDTKQYAFREMNARSYFKKNHGVRKLQIGTGVNRLPGWLNTDLQPHDKGIAYLNATKRFPFDDDTFDAIFSEHMLEHITYEQGGFMLRECWRVLKPGGWIRIVTPDLKALLALYQPKRTAIQEKYLRWMTDRFLGGLGKYEPVFVVNLAMRFSGHQFMYDPELLEETLAEAGFKEIQKVLVGESNHEVFRGVDSHGGFIEDPEINQYESMAFEARRPA